MKNPESAEKYLSYFLLWILLASCALLFLASLIFIAHKPDSAFLSQYAFGYCIRSRKAGIIRIIPFSGAAFRSPVSNSIHAIVSPYIEAEDDNLPAKKSNSY